MEFRRVLFRSGRLDVTVLLSEPGEIMPPQVMDVPVFKGTIVQAKGHLGGFGITVNGYAPALPSGRSVLGFDAPKNNAFSECDLILDLSGGQPLFARSEEHTSELQSLMRISYAV